MGLKFEFKIQPTNTYFGQKDIQQALLLRRLCRDLLLSHPTYTSLHIVPTARDPTDNLALSSRNAYLSITERAYAGTLYKALHAAEDAWVKGEKKSECVRRAYAMVEKVAEEARAKAVDLKVDYVEMNSSEDFEVLGDEDRMEGRGVLLSGAVWIGRTRLIDNLILGHVDDILT